MMRARRLYEEGDIVAGAQLCAACVAQLDGRRRRSGRVTVAVAVLVIAASGCGGSGAGPMVPDAADPVGGQGGAGGERPDGSRTDPPPPPNCTTARTACDHGGVVSCVDKKPGALIEQCQDACSLGRCTTLSCAQAENTEGVHGCRFYGAQVDNADLDDLHPTMLLLSNAGLSPATVAIQMREGGGDWAAMTTVLVQAGETRRVEFSHPLVDMGLYAGGAYRLESDAPVMAVEIISDDGDRTSRSSAGTVLRPMQALGIRHLALTAAAQNTTEVARTAGGRNGAGAIAIVGTTADTTVTIGVTAVAMALPGKTLQPLPRGTPPADSFVLQEGDVLQLFSIDSNGDLTGSSITSDYPVAVFTGNVFTTYGNVVGPSNGGDLVMEQLPPVSSWTARYVGARLTPGPACQSFFDGKASWRVLGSENDTQVTVTPAPGATVEVVGAPAGTTSFRLDEGTSQSLLVSGPVADFWLDAGVKRVLLAQWLDCEPGLSWGVDARLSGRDLAFALVPGFDTELVVVRRRGLPVALDDVTVPDSQFRSAAPFIGFEVARVSVAPCLDQWDDCQHRLTGPAFGASWRGVDVVCSYALTVPSRDQCALPVSNCPL